MGRIIITILSAVLDVFDVTARTWGLPWHPPGLSDHCSVVVVVSNKHSHDGLPRWTASTPQWQSVLQNGLAERLDATVPWRLRYLQVRDAVAAAPSEIQDFDRDVGGKTTASKLAIGLRALHALLG